jgi:uncharacterized membrane protein YgcG
MIFPVLIAKFLSAGAVAQAATGASVVVVAFTGIGAVGALPAPVQDTFATVVETVTPLEAPTSEDDTADTVPDETVVDDVVTEPTDETTESNEDEAETAEDAEFDLDAWIEAGPEGYDSFGAWVSESAHNADLKSALRARGQNFGSMVSKWAHDKGLDEDDLAAEGVDLDELTEGSTEPEAVVDADVTEVEQTEVAATTEDRGSRVSGNGKSGNGKSSSGKSSNGNGGGNGNGNGNGRN